MHSSSEKSSVSLDVNEVLANSVIGLVGLVTSWIGARISRFISKVNKAEKDLNAVFPKIRKIEKALGLDGGCDASRPVCPTGPQVIERGLREQGNGVDALGDQQEDNILHAGRSDSQGGG